MLSRNTFASGACWVASKLIKTFMLILSFMESITLFLLFI